METLGKESRLYYKLQDIKLLYKGFTEYLEKKYITKEELLDVLSQKVRESGILKNSTVVLDGFTGFTPVQMRLLRELLIHCRDVIITVTIDKREIIVRSGSATKEYDKTPLTNSEILSSDLYFDEESGKWFVNVTNEEFIYEALGVITDVGTANNNIDYVIKKANGDLSNSNYEVIVNEGTLEITPRLRLFQLQNLLQRQLQPFTQNHHFRLFTKTNRNYKSRFN